MLWEVQVDLVMVCIGMLMGLIHLLIILVVLDPGCVHFLVNQVGVLVLVDLLVVHKILFAKLIQLFFKINYLIINRIFSAYIR